MLEKEGAVCDSNVGQDGGQQVSMHSVIFVFFFLSSPLTHRWAGRDRTNAGHDSNTGQDKGTPEWEEEVEGRAGGLRRRVGRGGKRERAGDRNNVTAA